MAFLELKQDTYGFRVSFVAKDSDGNYIDLTNSTPWFYIGKQTSSIPFYSGQCTLGTYPKSGECYIDLPSSATSTPGVYHGELDIEYPSPAQNIIAQELTVIILPSVSWL